MGFFNRKIETRDDKNEEDVLLESFIDDIVIDKDKVLNIPALAGAIELIADTFAMIPIKLYKKTNDSVEYLKDDNRNYILNQETGDSLTAYDMKCSVARDYILDGNGYIFIKKSRNEVNSIHYVDSSYVSVTEGYDPIFKNNEFSVNGKTYNDYEFIKLLRHTKNGATGTGIVRENEETLKLMYGLINFESKILARGGLKNGYLESEKQLAQGPLDKLKQAWSALYKSRGEKAIVLNNGVKFKEASSTATEMQLNESKKTNSEEVAKMLNIPAGMFSDKYNDDTYRLFIKQTIMPICQAFEKALNQNLLLEEEKKDLYFAFDYSEIIKGDYKNRMEAYATGIKNGIMTINEARDKEQLEKIDGLNVIAMNLGNVVYDVDKKTYFTPNTGQIVDLNNPIENKGNEDNGNGI